MLAFAERWLDKAGAWVEAPGHLTIDLCAVQEPIPTGANPAKPKNIWAKPSGALYPPERALCRQSGDMIARVKIQHE
jgi:hypothetical protein